MSLNLVIVSENILFIYSEIDTVFFTAFPFGAEGRHISVGFDQHSYECPVTGNVRWNLDLSFFKGVE
jgi:hypothetical protein